MSVLPEEIIDRCFPLAEQVFSCGRDLLLVHAVHAVERMVRSRRGNPLTINVVEGARLRATTGRRAAAIYVPGASITQIRVDQNLTLEQKRRGVAHELGHILLAEEMIGHGKGLPDRTEESHERWCRDFEGRLCKLLHFLYTKTKFNEHMGFPTLEPEFRNEIADLENASSTARCSVS